jgi:hypothetical protein
MCSKSLIVSSAITALQAHKSNDVEPRLSGCLVCDPRTSLNLLGVVLRRGESLGSLDFGQGGFAAAHCLTHDFS